MPTVLGDSGWVTIDDQLTTTAAVTVTWPGGTPLSNATVATLPGATSRCQGVGTANAVGTILAAGIVDIHDNGNGTCNVRVATGNLVSPAGGTTVTVYLKLWGN
jgi:hypothetical protein